MNRKITFSREKKGFTIDASLAVRKSLRELPRSVRPKLLSTLFPSVEAAKAAIEKAGVDASGCRIVATIRERVCIR